MLNFNHDQPITALNERVSWVIMGDLIMGDF